MITRRFSRALDALHVFIHQVSDRLDIYIYIYVYEITTRGRNTPEVEKKNNEKHDIDETSLCCRSYTNRTGILETALFGISSERDGRVFFLLLDSLPRA